MKNIKVNNIETQNFEKDNLKKRGLPKFDSAGWLSIGIIFGTLMFGMNLWALIIRWNDTFIPFQIVKLLGIAVGLVLAIHCVDMIAYYRKHGPLK